MNDEKEKERLVNLESARETDVKSLEAEKPAEALESVLGEQKAEVNKGIEIVKERGSKNMEVLEIQGASPKEKKEFTDGEGKIEEKVEEAKEEWKNSLEYIENQRFIDEDVKDEDVKKELELYRSITEKRKEQFPEAFRQIESLAVKNGFKKLLIDSQSKHVHVKPSLSEEIVFYPTKALTNHEKLMTECDDSFSAKGADLVLQHEKSHFDKESLKTWGNYKKFIKDLANSKEEREIFKSVAEKKGIDLSQATKAIEETFINFIEMQTDLNSFAKSFESKEKFINEYAIVSVYSEFIYDGLESLTTKYRSDIRHRFIKPEILKEIDKRKEEIKKDLIEKKYATHEKMKRSIGKGY